MSFGLRRRELSVTPEHLHCGDVLRRAVLAGMTSRSFACRWPTLSILGMAFCAWLLTTRPIADAWFLPLTVLAGVAVWAATRRAREVAAASV